MLSRLAPGLILIATVAWLAAGCSRIKDRSGQIFVVTAGSENVKMGLVGVHVLTDAQAKDVATSLLKRYQLASEKQKARVAQCEMDERRLDGFSGELTKLELPDIRIGEIDDIRVEILQRKQGLEWSKQPVPTESILADGALANELFAALPAAVGKTDADGRFTVGAGEGDVLMARARRRVGKDDEDYLWIVPVTAQKAPILLSNDTLMGPAALLAYLSVKSGLSPVLPEAKAVAASAETEAWIKAARDRAVHARAKKITEVFEGAQQLYKNVLSHARPEILEKWGGIAWQKLQIEVASIDSKDPLAAAERFNGAAVALYALIADSNRLEEAAQARAEQERKRLAAEEQIAAERAEELSQNKAREEIRDAEERAARGRAIVAQENERLRKAAELEKLRNTPLFSGTASIVTSQFQSFEFGFGFWARSTFSGAMLRIYLNGKQPGAVFGGDKPDAEINLDKRLRGSEQYSSGGHDFQVEWDKPSKMSWSPKIIVRRLN